MQVSEDLSLYLRTGKSEGYSPATLRQFSYQLCRFAAWWGPRPLAEIGLQDLRDYVAIFDHLKVQSLGHVVRILRGFFRWLVDEEILQQNPAVKLKEPKLPKALPKALTFEELELLRDSCRTPLEHALLDDRQVRWRRYSRELNRLIYAGYTAGMERVPFRRMENRYYLHILSLSGEMPDLRSIYYRTPAGLGQWVAVLTRADVYTHTIMYLSDMGHRRVEEVVPEAVEHLRWQTGVLLGIAVREGKSGWHGPTRPPPPPCWQDWS